MFSLCFSDLLASVLAAFSNWLPVVRWPPTVPGLLPVGLTTCGKRAFSLHNSKQILRTESDSIGFCRVFIPEPIPGAKRINYADWACPSHVLSLSTRGGGCLGRVPARKTTWFCSPLPALFSRMPPPRSGRRHLTLRPAVQGGERTGLLE